MKKLSIFVGNLIISVTFYITAFIAFLVMCMFLTSCQSTRAVGKMNTLSCTTDNYYVKP